MLLIQISQLPLEKWPTSSAKTERRLIVRHNIRLLRKKPFQFKRMELKHQTSQFTMLLKYRSPQAAFGSGTELDKKDTHQQTALHEAVRKGHKEITELLITAGADLNTKDKNDRTPLDWSINQNNKSITDLLRKHGAKTGKELPPDISIHDAAWEGNIELKHLAVGTELDQKDIHRKTALHDAVRKGHKEIAKLLITAGANLNTKDRNNRTPLDWSINQKNRSITYVLRKHGAKTGKELPDISIHEAAWEGNIEAVKLHLAVGTDLDEIDMSQSALHWAVRKGNKEFSELLIGANLNAKDRNGSTPLIKWPLGVTRQFLNY